MKQWGNILGMIGDVGILFPILMGLALFNGMNFSLMLGMVGVAYILTSLTFRVPVPVQPFKVACTLALAQGLGPEVLQAAAFIMAFLLLLIGVTGLADRLSSLISKPVIRGLQLGVGLLLMQKGVLWVANGTILPESVPVHPESVWGLALVALVLPQLPLTLTNVAIGSADVGHRYYRWLAKKVSPGSLCISMGFINLMMGFMGTMPTCHGSSGWTAHRRLGGRSYLCTFFLGLAFVSVAVLLGPHARDIISAVPFGLLASLLVYVGCRHALLVRDVSGTGLALALLVGFVSFYFKNPALGLLMGVGIQSIGWRTHVNAY